MATRTLLSAGFAAPLAVIVILAGSFFYSLATLNRHVTNIVSDNVPGLVLSNRAATTALMYRAATLSHIMSKDAAEMRRSMTMVRRWPRNSPARSKLTAQKQGTRLKGVSTFSASELPFRWSQVRRLRWSWAIGRGKARGEADEGQINNYRPDPLGPYALK